MNADISASASASAHSADTRNPHRRNAVDTVTLSPIRKNAAATASISAPMTNVVFTTEIHTKCGTNAE